MEKVCSILNLISYFPDVDTFGDPSGNDFS
jgi:hypothetical protein